MVMGMWLQSHGCHQRFRNDHLLAQHVGIDSTKNAADNIKRVSLELGGKSPNLIMEDVDLEKAIKMGMTQCFFNTGQTCSAPTRMLFLKIT